MVLLLLTLIPTMIVNNIASGQGSNSCESEVSELLLSFQYPALDEVFVMGWYDYECDRFYLPVLEMFGHLDINRAVNRDEDKVLGSFLTDGKNYEINFHANEVIVGEQRRSYSPEMMKRGESDYYVSAEVFSDMFNMDFSLNISNLSVSLTSPHQMPVAAKESRIKARKNIDALSLKRSFYPLKYGRDRSLLSAGYIDYNMGIVSQPSTNGQDYNFQLEGGVEAFGGQLTGRNSFGHTSEGGWYRRNGNIRWRYDVRDVAAFSSLEVGQINTTGLMSQQINGVNVTNEPVEYLHFYGNSVVDGSTDANSEVELYLNNELVDFTISDAQGYYRFNVPLRYGSTRLRLKTYTPDGRLIENEKEIRIDDLKQMKKGSVLISFIWPLQNMDYVETLKELGISGLAMDTVPRISRAQSMDALSSMSNIAGYKAALIGADMLDKYLPMMMTAAGTIPPAKVLVLGAGVAGLQAIATSKRLGAVVEAYDIRPAVKEQVESLGATFVESESEEEADDSAETKSGYAKEQTESDKQKQQELVHKHVAKSDIVISTALVPGRPAPELIPKKMVDDMKAGSVIVDIAAEQGGNCELTKAGETVNHTDHRAGEYAVDAGLSRK